MRITNRDAALPGESIETQSPREQVVRARLSRKEKGQSLVEFALVLPVLLLVVTGITTFGLLINNYLALTDAVSTGARLLAINRGQTTDPCAITATAIENAAPYLTPANLTFTITLNGATVGGSSCSSTSVSTGAAADMVAGAPAIVRVTYPCNVTVYGTTYLPTCTLTAQTTEIIQ